MNTKSINELQAWALSERSKKRQWPDIAKALLDRGASPADMARAILPLVKQHGAVLAVLRAAVLLPEPNADFAAVRKVFEDHGVDLRDCVHHLMSHSLNKASNTAEAARRLGIRPA
jgi:hypothetical protein